MATIKEVLSIVTKKFGSDTPLNKAIDSDNLSDLEFSDEEVEQITSSVSNLLTPEAALSNRDLIEKFKESVNPQLKKSIYESVENDLKEVGTKFGLTFGKDAKVHEVIRKLKEYKPEKSKGIDELSKYQDEIKMLNEQNASLREEKENEIAELKSGFEKKVISSAIDKELNDYNLADVYNKNLVKKGIFDNVKTELFDKAVVKISESGSIDLFQKDMPDKQIYTEANKPLTFKDFVDPLMKDFVKKQDESRKGGNFTPQPPIRKKNEYLPNTMGDHLIKERQKMIKSQSSFNQ